MKFAIITCRNSASKIDPYFAEIICLKLACHTTVIDILYSRRTEPRVVNVLREIYVMLITFTIPNSISNKFATINCGRSAYI